MTSGPFIDDGPIPPSDVTLGKGLARVVVVVVEVINGPLGCMVG